MSRAAANSSAGFAKPSPPLCLGLSRLGLASIRAAFPDAVELQSQTPPEAVAAACAEVGPCLLVIDERALPEENAGRIPLLTQSPNAAVLALCRQEDDRVLRRALAAGCAGVLVEYAADSVIRRAVAAIRAGELWFPRRVLAQLARRVVRETSSQRLTAREREILELLGMEEKNQAIADKLFISRETVRWHLRALYGKLGVSSRSAARDYARQTLPPAGKIH